MVSEKESSQDRPSVQCTPIAKPASLRINRLADLSFSLLELCKLSKTLHNENNFNPLMN